MSKYAKKIVIRVFRENSWSENRVFMASIRRKKKRHAIISQEINTETNKMKDWSRKRKTDFIIGVALQIYLLFPWVQHYTIYGYLFNTLKINMEQKTEKDIENMYLLFDNNLKVEFISSKSGIVPNIKRLDNHNLWAGIVFSNYVVTDYEIPECW